MDPACLPGVSPRSRVFGVDRGKPVDRHYIDGFLERHAGDIRGRVLEFGDAEYTRRFGGSRVARSDVMYPGPGNPHATIVGDVQQPASLPVRTFDCIVCTQVLMYVWDLRTAIATMRNALAPGGVLLATVPGISQLSRADVERFGEFWRFTSQSAQRLFGEAFGPERVIVEAHGNVLAACAFLYGLTVAEVGEQRLDHTDPDYEVTITVRARA